MVNIKNPLHPTEGILRRLNNLSELRELGRHPLLFAGISSGDHPIQWQVYEDWHDWVRDNEIEFDPEDEGSLERWDLFELPMSAAHRYHHT